MKKKTSESCRLKKSKVIKTTQNSSLLEIYQIFNTENPEAYCCQLSLREMCSFPNIQLNPFPGCISLLSNFSLNRNELCMYILAELPPFFKQTLGKRGINPLSLLCAQCRLSAR